MGPISWVTRPLRTRFLLFKLAWGGQRICVPRRLYSAGLYFLPVFLVVVGGGAGAIAIDLLVDGTPAIAVLAFLIYVGASLVMAANIALAGVYLAGDEIFIATLVRVHRVSTAEVVRFGMPSRHAPCPVAWLRNGKTLPLWTIRPSGSIRLRRQTQEALEKLNQFIQSDEERRADRRRN